ncbi:uncharacterized protein BCR38DRAFT_410755 [Pseudomassariella vexata]|uniref:Uncharacterized protein n=1 Tax=Pseudomassariella vexata TaxID=1141098 RepID=A0A1Y2DSU6_9PEZI|nr:uncharacterized protein BCR38DRAFT_410755 [Pseudomassariella vexata]ORY62327.1 hypothetical protein BCR38DRAFT_410755 [Pseudomassariella vexata]
MSGHRRSVSLEAPERKGIEDPGAHDLASSDDEHFSDAQSAPRDSPRGAASPIPKTRVEKVDDEPSYGEVPGTDAYEKRVGDAAPDEIAIIPDAEAKEQKSNSTEDLTMPGGHPIPKTVVEETADAPGSTTQNFHEQLRKADAAPDLVRKADGTSEANMVPASLETMGEATDDVPVSPVSPALKSPMKYRRRKSSAAESINGSGELAANGFDDDGADDGDFGDDFDEFEEGDEDGDFGDFDDGFQQADAETSASPPVAPPSVAVPSFLAAPPPLQPPDWIRSRIRRLFLVSLGVPVDLDEILPASKQKKLVLPSLHRVTSNGSLRTSSDSHSISRLREPGTNDSTVSVDSQGKEKPHSASRRQKGPPPAPKLDLVSAKQLCTTTEEALGGMTDDELKAHVKRLEDMQGLANELLEYWKKRTDEKIGDREAFEDVIENLVKHARKTRK